MNSTVKVHLYDLSRGLARSMSMPLIGRQIEGIWHTGIVVYNQEYFFGGHGIESCAPAHTILGEPDQIIDLGYTEIPFEVFWDYMRELAETTCRPRDYNLMNRNCNNFTAEMALFLTGKEIPSHITGLPAEILSTPFGQMIRPFLDAMTANPGHEVMNCFSNTSSGNSTTTLQDSSSNDSSVGNKCSNNSHRTGADNSNPAGAENSSKSAEHPITFKVERLPDMESLTNVIALQPVLEYLYEENPDWSLAPKQITAVKDEILVGNTSAGWLLLQALTLHEGVLDSLQVSYRQGLNIVLTADQLLSSKTLCNLSSTGAGVEFMNENQKITSELLQPNTHPYNSNTDSEYTARLSAAYNISLNMKPGTHDIDIQLTSALVAFIKVTLIDALTRTEKNLSTILNHFYLALRSLHNLMKNNEQMCDLVMCLELDVELLRDSLRQQPGIDQLKHYTSVETLLAEVENQLNS